LAQDRCVLYARVSSREQAEKDLSIPAQLKALREFSQKNGWEIAAEFVDAGVSARTDERSEFKNMIAFVRNKKNRISKIFVHKLDRFSRNRENAVVYKNLLKRDGVTVESITERFDPETPVGLMISGILETVAEFYSANLSQEVKKGMLEKAQKGKAVGELPYGYTAGPDGTISIYEPEARVVRAIYTMYVTDNKGSRTISQYLRGPAAVARFGKAVLCKNTSQQLTWSASSITRLIRNPAYKGDFVWHKDDSNPVVIQSNHQPIVDADQWEIAQEILRKRQRKKNHRVDYLFCGLLRCMECGASMYHHVTRRTNAGGKPRLYRYFRCTRHSHSRDCYTNSHPAPVVEHNVMVTLQHIVSKQVDFEALDIVQTRSRTAEEGRANLQAEYRSIQQQFERQMTAYQAGVIGLAELRRYRHRLEEQKREVMKELSRLQQEETGGTDRNVLVHRVDTVLDAIQDESIPVAQKRNALMRIIDHIALSARKQRIHVCFKIPPECN